MESQVDSIFTKIIKGEIPSHKVFEDDKTYAFMDIYPVQPGMVLVVSKTQVDNLEDLNDTEAAALWAAVHVMAKKLRATFPDKKKIAVQVEGLDVPHVHVKLFPFDTNAEFHAAQDTAKEPDHAMLAELARKIQLA